MCLVLVYRMPNHLSRLVHIYSYKNLPLRRSIG